MTKRFDQPRLDADFSAGEHAEWNVFGCESLVALGDQRADLVAAIVRPRAKLMRRGDDRRGAVLGRETGHRQRVVPVLCAVVDAGQNVTVNVCKRFVHGSGVLYDGGKPRAHVASVMRGEDVAARIEK